MSKELFNLLREKNLNYQDLSKIDDDKWVLVNVNVLYYLLSFYQRKNRNELVIKSLHIIKQHFDDIEVLKYNGIDETGETLMYHHMPAKDAKILFKPWEEEGTLRPLAVLKDMENKIFFPPSKLPKLRKDYLENKQEEQRKEEYQKELKWRKQKGYIV